MTVRRILLYPDQQAALRKKCEPVQGIDRSVRKLIADLTHTLLAHPEGIGLAAPQLNDHRRVVVVRLDSGCQEGLQAGPPMPIINPAILEARDEHRDFDGCLSFPGLYGLTIRPHYLHVAGLDEQGRPLDQVFEDFDAVMVHHEIDHLDGVLFIDRLERVEDLYRVLFDENGRRVRMPVSMAISEGLGGS